MHVLKVVTSKNRNVNGSIAATRGGAKKRRFYIILSGIALCLLIAIGIVAMLMSVIDKIDYADTWSISPAINSTEIPPTTSVVTKPTGVFIYNENWGGIPPKNSTRITPATLVVIKHTGGLLCTDTETCKARVRDIQKTDMEEHQMPDIRYNFLIGADGKVYVGRGWGIRNEGRPDSMDIAFIGNFSKISPTESMIRLVKRIITRAQTPVEKALEYGEFVIVNHNQTEQTDSPGEQLFKKVTQWESYSNRIYFNSTISSVPK